MGDPVTTATMGLEVAAPIFGGLAGSAEARGQKRQAEANSFIARTRAIQTDTQARKGLDSELATMRAVFAANGQRPGIGTLAVMDELRDERGRERRIEVGNRMQEAADWRMAGRNASAKARTATLGGFIGAGPSLFDVYETTRVPRPRRRPW